MTFQEALGVNRIVIQTGAYFCHYVTYSLEHSLIFDARGDDALEPFEGHGDERPNSRNQEGFAVPF